MGKNLVNLTDFKEVAGFPQYAVSKRGDIPIIRKLREQGETQARIAEMFKVERTAVRAVLDGVTWRHVV